MHFDNQAISGFGGFVNLEALELIECMKLAEVFDVGQAHKTAMFGSNGCSLMNEIPGLGGLIVKLEQLLNLSECVNLEELLDTCKLTKL